MSSTEQPDSRDDGENREREDEVVVSAPPPGIDRRLVVHVTSPSHQNPVHRTYRALLALGVRIAHTRVRTEGARTVQVVQLMESDDRLFGADRIAQILIALQRHLSPTSV